MTSSAAPLPVRARKWGYRPRHHSFEMVFLVVGTLVSVPLALGAIPPPDSTASFLDRDLLTAWSWMLLVGSTLGLLGLLWFGRPVTAMVIERVGLIVLSGAVLLYVAGTVSNVTLAGTVPILINFAYGTACALRAFELGNEIKGLVTKTENFKESLGSEQQVRDHFQEQDKQGDKA